MFTSQAIRLLLAFNLVLVLGATTEVTRAQVPSLSVWSQGDAAGWSEWSMQGVTNDGGALVLDRHVTDSQRASGSLDGPVRELPFDELIPSWNVHTPPETWIETLARVRIDGAWTGWYSMGRWASDKGQRQSVKGQDDDRVKVLTDTLRVQGTANAYQLRLTLNSNGDGESPQLTLVAAVATSGATASKYRTGNKTVAATTLDVPGRSQMIYPDGGEVWCSPTSTSMVMAYWSEITADPRLNRPVPEVAAGTYDPVYRGNGNWSFNTAYAGDAGLTAFVSRGASLHDAERWLAAGVPVIASLGWAGGQLPEAPIGSTNGHLLVIVGVTEQGDVVVNDPAADPRRGQSVRRVYDRGSFESLWLSYSGGTMYIMYPPITRCHCRVSN